MVSGVISPILSSLSAAKKPCLKYLFGLSLIILLSISDLITDLTSTGNTLKMNHLKVIETILESSIILITNKESMNNKKILIEAVTRSIKGVIDAFGKKLIMMKAL